MVQNCHFPEHFLNLEILFPGNCCQFGSDKLTKILYRFECFLHWQNNIQSVFCVPGFHIHAFSLDSIFHPVCSPGMQMWRANRMHSFMPFYITDLSICGFWYGGRRPGTNPLVDSKGGLSFWVVKSYVDFWLAGAGPGRPCKPRDGHRAV